MDGKILVHDGNSNASQWEEFTPQTDGKPTFGVMNRGISEAQVARSTLSLATTGISGGMKQLTIDLFRGPAGDFLRQIVTKTSAKARPLHRLSFDGTKIAFGSRERIEVQATDSPQRLLMTSGGNASHRAPQLWTGDRAFLLSVGRQGYSWHLVDWTGALTVRTEKARTLTPSSAAFKNEALRRFVHFGCTQVTCFNAHVIVSRNHSGSQILVDQHGQVEIRTQKATVFRFYARGESWTAWLPDGTRLGSGTVHQWENSPGAAAKMGNALRTSIERGGA
jgi:hypothetical protein